MNKFRVWCKNKNEWERHKVYLDDDGHLWHVLSDKLIPLKPETHIALFSTGLHDKNGKEIYDGDIISGLDMHPDVVEFKDGVFTLKGCELSVIGAIRWFNKVQVIGNIHEHPHLLEAQ